MQRHHGQVAYAIAALSLFIACARQVDNRQFEMKGLVLSTKELQEVDWPNIAARNGINTIGTHVTPSEVIGFLSSESGRKFTSECRRLGIRIEHQLHSISELLPRELIVEDSTMFRMDSLGRRTADYNCCAHSEKALEIISVNAARLAKILSPDNHRYYFWLDDDAPTCFCPLCKGYLPSEQALIIENKMLGEIRKIDPQARLAHLAYASTMEPPKKVLPDEGIFLEFAPINRSWNHPISQVDALCQRDESITNGDNIRWLEKNLEVFPAEEAVVLEYWLDVSLFSGWRRPAAELPWRGDVCASDLATYAQYGIKNVTSFAVYMDHDYFNRFPSTKPIEDYGCMLNSFRSYNALINPWDGLNDDTFVGILTDGETVHLSFAVSDSTMTINTSANERSVGEEDRVEVFLSCDPEMKCYYGFEIDPLGKVMDYKNTYYRNFNYI